MKQNTCIGVMVIESTFALISMGLLFSDIGAVIYPISLLIFAAVLAPFYIRLREESDEAKKKKDPPEHGPGSSDPHCDRSCYGCGRRDRPDDLFLGLKPIPEQDFAGALITWIN